MRLAERETVQMAQQRPQRDQQSEGQHDGKRRLARERRGQDQEFAHEDAHGREAHDRDHAEHETPSQDGVGHGEAANVGHLLRPFDLRDVPDGKEDRGLGQRVHDHVQQAGEVGERPAHAERETDDPHVLDGRVGEHPLDVVAAVQHERREHDRDQSQRDHQRPRRERLRIGRHHHLEAQHGEQRDVEEQPRKDGRNGRRPFGVRVGQPGVQRHEARPWCRSPAAGTRTPG